MPTYDFKCRKCGEVFEHFQKMSDTTTPTCPQVQLVDTGEGKPKAAVRCLGETDKVFRTAAPAHFHGGGWAADNYSKKR